MKSSIKKPFLFVFFSLITISILKGQDGPITLRNREGKIIQLDTFSTTYENICRLLSATKNTSYTNVPMSLVFARNALKLSIKANNTKLIGPAYNSVALLLLEQGNFPEAFFNAFRSYHVCDSLNLIEDLSVAVNTLSLAYGRIGNYRMQNNYLHQALQILEKFPNPETLKGIYINLALSYSELRIYDSAKYFANIAELKIKPEGKPYDLGLIYGIFGSIYRGEKSYEQALYYYRLACGNFNSSINNKSVLSSAYNGIAEVFFELKKYDSSIFYGKEAYKMAKVYNQEYEWMNAADILSRTYDQKRQFDSAYMFQIIRDTTREHFFSLEKTVQWDDVVSNAETKKREIEKKKEKVIEENNTHYKFFVILFVLLVLVTVYVLLLKRVVLKINILRGIGVVLLLLIFEFFNLIAHPWLEHVTDHNPYYMLGGLVIIASILSPLHHFIEKDFLKKAILKTQKDKINLLVGEIQSENLETSNNNLIEPPDKKIAKPQKNNTVINRNERRKMERNKNKNFGKKQP